jgi:hypothetical protein
LDCVLALLCTYPRQISSDNLALFLSVGMFQYVPVQIVVMDDIGIGKRPT